MSAFINSHSGAPLRRRAAAVALLAASAVLATTGAAHAAAVAPAVPSSSLVLATVGAQEEMAGTDEQNLAGIEEALKLISAIPDEVLAQGDAATVQWLEEHDSVKAEGGRHKRSFSAGGCARGILLAVGSNIFALGKVYKVKKAIDKLGGAAKIVNKIRSKKKMGKTFKKGIAEIFEEAGSGLGGIAAEILGVDGVIKNCW
ncbi:hypothetical protein AB0M92_38855 [Streptomyces sp. NPDC051582]|uniref:hypothetical protein n=1 Tax=Streptomyces sp. NPDC051582 TaxID=3155167 RepID=UPI003418649E